MNAELKKHLEDAVAALIDGNTEAATKALHEYFPKKARALIVGESEHEDKDDKDDEDNEKDEKNEDKDDENDDENDEDKEKDDKGH